MGSERYEKYREKNLAQAKKWQAANPEKVKNWAKRYRTSLRREVVEAYGGMCVCCGEHRWKFLTLDHPSGDGQSDRAKYRMQTGQFYAWVKSQGFPKGTYRLLCMNCNWVRRYDTCPHEDEKDPNYKEAPYEGMVLKRKPRTGIHQRIKFEPMLRKRPTPVEGKDTIPKPIINPFRGTFGKRAE